MSKRIYSDEEKGAALAALDANKGNVHGTARLLGIPDSTLDEWARGRNQSAAVPNMRERKKGELAEKFDEVAHMLLDATTDDAEGVQRTGVRDRMVAAGVAVDKKLLLAGKATQIHEHRAGPSEMVRRAYEALVTRFNRAPDEAVVIIAERFQLSAGELSALDEWRAGVPMGDR